MQTAPTTITMTRAHLCQVKDSDLLVYVTPGSMLTANSIRLYVGHEGSVMTEVPVFFRNKITDGTISIYGTVVNTRQPAESDNAMVFQN